MSYIYSIIVLAAPLLLISFGALISEYAGRMALFLEGLINLSAFLCYTFTVYTHSVSTAILLSVFCSVCLIAGADIFTQKTKANPFITSLALNLFCSALAETLSVKLFSTQGVLTSPLFNFQVSQVHLFSVIATVFLFTIGALTIYLTKHGLYLRITGSDADVLEARGIKASLYRSISWIIAAAYTAVAGCMLSLSLSSFTPNISSGRGWMALVIVFLGKRKLPAVVGSVFLIAAVQLAANYVQNITNAIPSAILFALPYLVAILLLFITPKNKANY